MNAAEHVLLRLKGHTRMKGHDLHQPTSPGPGNYIGLATALDQHHGRHQIRVQHILVGILNYERAPDLDGLRPSICYCPGWIGAG